MFEISTLRTYCFRLMANSIAWLVTGITRTTKIILFRNSAFMFTTINLWHEVKRYNLIISSQEM